MNRVARHLLLGALSASLMWCSLPARATPPDRGISGLQALIAGKVLTLSSPNGSQPDSMALPHPSQDYGPLQRLLDTLLTGPLGADTAVRIALLNNPALQMHMAETGLDLSDASHALHPAKLKLQQEVTLLSAYTLSAWVNAVAAAQALQAMQEAQASAEAAGELSRRMAQVGNTSKLTQAKQQAVLSEASLQVAHAQSKAFAAKEALVLAMGVWGRHAQFALPSTLPALPKQVQELPHVEAEVVAARQELKVQSALWQQKRSLPAVQDPSTLWDAMGDAASVRALAVKARSEARDAYFQYRNAFDVAQHYQAEVLPTQQFIHDELVLRYNGMLTSLFDVLAQSQALRQTKASATEAQQAFWLAHIALQALRAGLPADALANAASELTQRKRPIQLPGTSSNGGD